MRRALLVCPGRGSYDRAALGQLQDRSPHAAEVVARCDAWRQQVGRPTITELDAAERYQGRLHVAGEHASLLTFACSMADLAELDRERFEVVGVVGNSMGFYTALAASGALPLDEAIRLVDTLGAYQKDNVIGGQLLYPVTDEAWRPAPALSEAVRQALAEAERRSLRAWASIHLGAHTVLGADEEGLSFLQQALPQVQRGERTFPIRLPLHSAFHTPLMAETSARARADLADLSFGPPRVPLVDGRGVVFRPRWASPDELADYTLGHQVVDTFDLALSVRTALAHTAPEVVVVLGPGNSLGGPLACMLVQAGWGGCRDRAAFEARQRGEAPLLLSFGVGLQRRRLV